MQAWLMTVIHHNRICRARKPVASAWFRSAMTCVHTRQLISAISMTGNAQSTLAQASDVHLDASVESEACPLDLAPTASTTVALVMGDALAIALLEARGFTAEDFAFSHPGGALGRKLLLKVEDIMHTGDRVPVIPPETTLTEALLVMNAKGLGLTTVCDQQQRLLGILIHAGQIGGRRHLRRLGQKRQTFRRHFREGVVQHGIGADGFF